MALGSTRIVGDVTLAALFAAGAAPHGARHVGDLLPGRAYARASPIFLDRGAADPAMARIIDATFEVLQEPALPLALVEVDEAIVFGQGSVVLPDGRLIHESAREFILFGGAPEGATASGSGWLLPDRPFAPVAGRTLLVKRPWYRNYGHWLVDLMPIIPMVARHGVRVDTILFGEVPEGAVKALMTEVAALFLPDARVIWIGDEAQLRCDTLLYVRPTHQPPVFKHPLAMQLTVDTAHALTRGPPVATPRAKLYVSRQSAAARRITNAAAVEDVLAASGFETIRPDECSFAEQVAAFARADSIVGVKGAGLTNVLFCRPGAELLVLSPADFPDPFFWDLATQRGLGYGEIFCAALATPEAPTGRSDFEVDLKSLRRFLAGERRAAPRRPDGRRGWLRNPVLAKSRSSR